VPAAGLEPTLVRPRKPALCPLSYAGCIWYPWRESNSHPQLRKLSLYPLSYRGWVPGAPPTGLEPATTGSGNRYAIHCATGALGRSDGIEPSTAGSQATMLPLHHDHHAKNVLRIGCTRGGGGSRTPNRVSRGGSLAPSCITFLPRLQVEWRIGESNPCLLLARQALFPTELIPQRP
jgi:hypothetical protein